VEADGASPRAFAACPVCRTPSSIRAFMTVESTPYWRCESCRATLLDPGARLSPAQEHAYYLSHENEVHDQGYRRFLSKLADPLLQRLTPGSRGLDYGCGPGPALAAMCAEAGHAMAVYDPLFAPDERLLDAQYDFFTCTETAEHFHAPAAEFDRLAALVRPGGWLGLMTCFQTEDRRFAGWRYRMDPTHVVFYREETIRILADQRALICEIPCKDVALLRKPV